MPIQHILYIPTIFILGLVFGTMITDWRRGSTALKTVAPNSENSQRQFRTPGKKALLMFLIFMLVFIITHIFEIPWGSKAVTQRLGGLEMFDRKPVFSANEVYNRLQQFPLEGINVYKRFTYTIDFIFPFSFFAFLLTLARFVSQRIIAPKLLMKMMVSLPILWFASDLLENSVIYSILSIFPNRSEVLGSSLGPITTIKFGLLMLAILLPSLFFIFAKRVTESNKS